MKRYKGFEWEDQPWFPSFLRQYMMDFLRFVLDKGNLYKPVTPLLVNALRQTKSEVIVDLCSGGGGAVQSVQKNLEVKTGKITPFILTDLYPNISVYKKLQTETEGNITYYKEPVNAADVPAQLKGFRTVFSGFHHFDKATAKEVLQNAASAGEGIAVFDGGSRSTLFILTILIFHPIAFVLFTPFIKPFSLKRIFFTYLLPIVPFCAIWDGVASVLRLYKPNELLQMADGTKSLHRHRWQTGIVTNRIGIKIAYIIGVPTEKN